MLSLSQINLFPIKSLGGTSQNSVRLTDRGLENDRRRMLVDQNGKFLTQRTHPVMSQLLVSIQGNNLHVCDRRGSDTTVIPMIADQWRPVRVTIFADTCDALAYPKGISDWFSQRIGESCELVYMPDDSNRPIDPKLSTNNEQFSFADGCQVLIVGEASLADLNARLEKSVTMDRFRPNLVFSGGESFEEDTWKRIRIGNSEFTAAMPCARCVLTTVDPVSGETGKEPLKTLASYRKQEDGVMFGQNLLHGAEGEVCVGDKIEVLES